MDEKKWGLSDLLYILVDEKKREDEEEEEEDGVREKEMSAREICREFLMVLKEVKEKILIFLIDSLQLFF